jgi:putative endonuclease
VAHYVYILSNNAGTVLYTGVTSNLHARTDQHKKKLVEGFTKKYNVNRLVFYEESDEAMSAFEREKQIKGRLS